MIRRSGKTIIVRVWSEGKIGLRVEVNIIEGRGGYQGIRFEGGTDLISPYEHPEY